MGPKASSMSDHVPAPLRDVVQLIRDDSWRNSFSHLFNGSAAALEALGELDLTPYESEKDEAYGFQVWDRMAPVVAQTQSAVHDLLKTIDDEFVEPPSDAGSDVDRACTVVQELGKRLRTAVEQFRADSQRPEIMADRWNLLQAVAAFRGRARSHIGEMVFASASTFAQVAKADVVPFYRDDIEVALLVRRGIGELVRQTQALEEEIQDADDDERPTYARMIRETLRSFAASEAYSVLRVTDRRVMAEARDELDDLLGEKKPNVPNAIERLGELVSYLAKVNERETLVLHDRDVVADAVMRLRDAREHIRTGILRAGIEAQSALRLVERLQGKNPEVDVLIETIRTQDLERGDFEDLLSHIDQLEGLVRGFQANDDES